MSIPTMQPVLRRGRSVLDRALLPGDENEGRLNHLLERAAELNLDGVVVFGAAHLPENLVYYGNYVPTTFHGVIVARAGRPPVLIAGKGGARDHPYIRTVSWIADVRYYAEVGAGIAEIVDGWGAGPVHLGTVGLDDTLPHHVRDGIAAALPERLSPIDELAIEQRRFKSARELAVLAEAAALAGSAAEAARAAFAAGAGSRTALAAADFAARAGNAHDCRVTAGTLDGDVANLSELEDDDSPLSALVAVEYLGYWGVAALDSEADDSPALEQLVERLRPGVDARDVLAAASSADERFVVNGIGCAPAEAPDWELAPRTVLLEGDVLSIVRLRTEGRLRLSTRTVVITATGSRTL